MADEGNGLIRVEDVSDNVSYIYWTLLSMASLTPLVMFALVAWRKPMVLQMLRSPLRYRPYGLRHLERHGELQWSLCYILLYRHRPMILDFIKVAIEFAFITHFVQLNSVRGAIIWWCVYDVMVVAFIINLLDLKRRPGSGQGATIAFWIYSAYSVAFGFPLGFISKVLWILWASDMIEFHYMFFSLYIGAFMLFALAVFYFLPITLMSICCKNETVFENRSRGSVAIAFVLFSLCWASLFGMVELCQTPSAAVEGKTLLRHDDFCILTMDTYTSAMMPLSIEIIIVSMVLTCAITFYGMLWRFLPEVCSVWAAGIAFLTSMYHQDDGDDRILYAAVLVLGVSGLITLTSNMCLTYVIIYTVRYVIPGRNRDIAAGRRPRPVTEQEKKQRVQLRENMLVNFLKSKGKLLSDTDVGKAREDKKEKISLKGTLFNKMGIQSKEQMTRCCICFEEYTGNKHDIILAIMKGCGHYFHYDCIWDWLLKRPTCPMCREDIPMSEDGIRVISYFDLKYAIKLNRPRDPDAQSRISTISGISDGTSLDEDLSSRMTPPPTLKAIVKGPQGQDIQDRPLPHPPDQQIDDSASIFPPARNSSDHNTSETAVVEMGESVEDNDPAIVSSGSNNQPIEAVVTVANTDEAGPSSRQDISTAEASSSGVSVVNINSPGASGRSKPPQDTSNSGSQRHNRENDHGSHRAQSPRRRQQQPSDKISISKLQHRLHQQKIRTLQPPTKRKYQQNIDPKSRQNVDSKSRRTPLPTIPHYQNQNDDLESETPHTRRKRQSRRHCEICGKRYEGAARDIVVGYIPHCGHFYHCLCLDSYVRKHGTCPRCHYEHKRSRMAGHSTTPERQISRVDVFFAFLADMLQDSSSEQQQSNTRGVDNGAFSLPPAPQSTNRL